jgi:hypothetical protein
MTFLCVLKNVDYDKYNEDNIKYWCFIEIEFIQNSSNNDYKLTLSKLIESNYCGNINNWKEYIPQKQLDKEKYYLFMEGDKIGYKHINDQFISLEDTLIKNKLVDILIEEEIIKKNILPF